MELFRIHCTLKYKLYVFVKIWTNGWIQMGSGTNESRFFTLHCIVILIFKWKGNQIPFLLKQHYYIAMEFVYILLCVKHFSFQKWPKSFKHCHLICIQIITYGLQYIIYSNIVLLFILYYTYNLYSCLYLHFVFYILIRCYHCFQTLLVWNYNHLEVQEDMYLNFGW